MNSNESTTAASWPATRFYWAVLDGMGWERGGALPPGLLDALADELPVPAGEVHAVGVTLGDGRVLVCAAPRDALEALDPGLISLKPECVPSGLGAEVDPCLLNVLVGAFEPGPVRAARRSRQMHLASTCLLCALVMAVGLWRRTTHALASGARSGANTLSLLSELTPDRREETLGAQVRAMQSVVEVAARTKPPADAAAGFESLLKAWPTEVACKPQSVSVAGDGVSVGVVVEGDAAPFLRAFHPPAQFVLDEPRLTTVGTFTRLSLHLRPGGEGGRP